MLGCSYLGDGYGYTTGNVSHVTGQNGTFTSGMEFDFPFQQPCDNYIDQIGANGGTLLFRSQDSNGRIICSSGASGSYRSIHATCVFGALRNGSSTKAELMVEYMNYLTQTIGVHEIEEVSVTAFTLSPNPAYQDVDVRFTMSNDADVTLRIYNSVGQIVRVLIDQRMTAGVHSLRWDRQDDQAHDVSSGAYVFTIRVDQYTRSGKVILVK